MSHGIGWLLLYIAINFVNGQGTSPPYIKKPEGNTWPESIRYVRPKSKIEDIVCKAEALPEATYHWTVNNTEISSNNIGHVSYNNMTGVLIIGELFTTDDNGAYQCRASNLYGTVLTPYLTLLSAEVIQISGSDRPVVVRAPIYSYLKLDCKDIPPSKPRWDFKWKMQDKTINESERMSIDPKGNLHILWVEQSDDNVTFTCNAVNKLLNMNVGWRVYQLETSGNQSNVDPVLRYCSDVVAMAGSTANLICIFSYYSSPGEHLTIDWYRQGTMVNTVNNTSFYGRVLNIANVQVPTSARNQSGEYECHPKIGNLPREKLIPGKVNLKIIAPPEFVEDKAPVYTAVPVGEDAVFKCYAKSYNAYKKSPVWLINGTPLLGCPLPMFECKQHPDGSSVCIQDRLLCSNNSDCTYGRDEEKCPIERCGPDQNDFNNACPSMNNISTFPECQCYNYFTKCLQRTKLCDDISDCTDGSDERACLNRNTLTVNRYRFNYERTKMTIPGVTQHDSICVQCMVSNEYGTIVGNGCITVAAPAKISQTIVFVIVGSCAGLVVLVLVAVRLVFRCRRKECKVQEMSSMSTGIDRNSAYGIMAEAFDVTLATGKKQLDAAGMVKNGCIIADLNALTSIEYSNVPSEQVLLPDSWMMPATAIKIEDLFDQVFTKEDATLDLEKQFEALPRGLLAAHNAALKPENKIKNRYKNMYAYDETRVVLETDDEEENDYINACFIQGFTKPQAYVASQGPTEEILDDFWRMVWQLKSGKIVMLTNLVENNRVKCHQYWPSGGQEIYGKVSVALLSSELFHDYTVRTFVLKKNSEERHVTQFHFISWPSRDILRIVSSFANFLNKVKNAPSESNGPMIVHCSAGVGRTGTFIALDYLIDQSKELGYVDVVGCVLSLRMQRVDLVQTLEQYLFVHQVLVELLMLSSSGFPSYTFPKGYQELLQIDPNKRKRKLDLEFEMMTAWTPTSDMCSYKSIQFSLDRVKNRYQDILPVAEFMPTIDCCPGSHSSYINAVFLPNYKQLNGFIITQSPLESTKEDFWKLVYEHGVHTIVMMNDISELKEEEIYWPTKGNRLLFGHMVVSLSKTQVVNGNVVIVMKLTKFQIRRKIKLLQCGHWKACKELPESTVAILDLLGLVQNWQQQTGNNTILVHCMNGAFKSGLFCVICAVIERLKIEQDVAISQCIQEMRRRREQIIPSVEQFQFCHEVILAFLQQNDTYSNFNSMEGDQENYLNLK